MASLRANFTYKSHVSTLEIPLGITEQQFLKILRRTFSIKEKSVSLNSFINQRSEIIPFSDFFTRCKNNDTYSFVLEGKAEQVLHKKEPKHPSDIGFKGGTFQRLSTPSLGQNSIATVKVDFWESIKEIKNISKYLDSNYRGREVIFILGPKNPRPLMISTSEFSNIPEKIVLLHRLPNFTRSNKFKMTPPLTLVFNPKKREVTFSNNREDILELISRVAGSKKPKTKRRRKETITSSSIISSEGGSAKVALEKFQQSRDFQLEKLKEDQVSELLPAELYLRLVSCIKLRVLPKKAEKLIAERKYSRELLRVLEKLKIPKIERSGVISLIVKLDELKIISNSESQELRLKLINSSNPDLQKAVRNFYTGKINLQSITNKLRKILGKRSIELAKAPPPLHLRTGNRTSIDLQGFHFNAAKTKRKASDVIKEYFSGDQLVEAMKLIGSDNMAVSFAVELYDDNYDEKDLIDTVKRVIKKSLSEQKKIDFLNITEESEPNPSEFSRRDEADGSTPPNEKDSLFWFKRQEAKSNNDPTTPKAFVNIPEEEISRTSDNKNSEQSNEDFEVLSEKSLDDSDQQSFNLEKLPLPPKKLEIRGRQHLGSYFRETENTDSENLLRKTNTPNFAKHLQVNLSDQVGSSIHLFDLDEDEKGEQENTNRGETMSSQAEIEPNEIKTYRDKPVDSGSKRRGKNVGSEPNLNKADSPNGNMSPSSSPKIDRETELRFNSYLTEFILSQTNVPTDIVQTCSELVGNRLEPAEFIHQLVDFTKTQFTSYFKEDIAPFLIRKFLDNKEALVQCFEDFATETNGRLLSKQERLLEFKKKAMELLENIENEENNFIRKEPEDEKDLSSPPSIYSSPKLSSKSLKPGIKDRRQAYQQLFINTSQYKPKKSFSLLKVKPAAEDNDDAVSQASVSRSGVSMFSSMANEREKKREHYFEMMYKNLMNPKKKERFKKIAQDIKKNLGDERSKKFNINKIGELIDMDNEIVFRQLYKFDYYRLKNPDILKSKLEEIASLLEEQANKVLSAATQMSPQLETRRTHFVMYKSFITFLCEDVFLINNDQKEAFVSFISVENIFMQALDEFYFHTQDIDELVDSLFIYYECTDFYKDRGYGKGGGKQKDKDGTLLFAMKKDIDFKTFQTIEKLFQQGDQRVLSIFESYAEHKDRKRLTKELVEIGEQMIKSNIFINFRKKTIS